jgi:hypothetical protein
MTLGCGGYGGNITSDNIGPRHLLNIKRLAYEVTPAQTTARGAVEPVTQAAGPALPKAPVRVTSTGIAAAPLAKRIDDFLASRGLGGQAPGETLDRSSATGEPRVPASPATPAASAPQEFVCEEDVRRAISSGTKIVLAERAIVTPAARELGESRQVFVTAGWR